MTLAGILDWASQQMGGQLSREMLFDGIVSAAAFTAFVFFLLDCVRRRPSFRSFEELSSRLPWTGVDVRILIGYLLGAGLLAIALVVTFMGVLKTDALPCTVGEAAVLENILRQGAIALFLIGRLRHLRIPPRAFFGFSTIRSLGGYVPYALYLILAALPVVFVSGQLWNQLLDISGFDLGNQQVLQILQSPSETLWVRGLLVILGSLIGPITEEIMFRGILFPIVTRHFGTTYAIIIVSLMFSLFHFYTLGLVPIFVVAVFFSLGYAWSGSLLVPMIMHVCFNSIQLVSLYLASPVATP